MQRRDLLKLVGIGMALATGAPVVANSVSVDKIEAWIGVGADQIESTIDVLLGKEKVMRKQAEQAIARAHADIPRLADVVATSRVEAEMLDGKIAQIQEQVAQSQAMLVQLADWIEQGESVLVADGSRWDVAELQRYAQLQMERHKILDENLAVYTQAAEMHRQASNKAYAALQLAQQTVINLEAKLELLDARMQLLESVRSQPGVGLTEANTANAIDEAQALLDNLLDDVERETRVSEERAKVGGAEMINLPPTTSDALVSELRELAGDAR